MRRLRQRAASRREARQVRQEIRDEESLAQLHKETVLGTHQAASLRRSGELLTAGEFSPEYWVQNN